MALNSNAIQQISIHASAKEATYYRPAAESAGENFNPRLREGGDKDFRFFGVVNHISIHASAKEATLSPGRSRGSPDFNPRLREGGDRNIL